jgi:hypothetical protein
MPLSSGLKCACHLLHAGSLLGLLGRTDFDVTVGSNADMMNQVLQASG